MRNILAIITLISCVLAAKAQTNSLWLQTTVPPTNLLSPRQVCDLIETESAKLDPAGQGLTVLFQPGFDKWGKAELTFSPAPISFFELLDFAASVYAFPSNSAKVFGTVGVIPWKQYRYAYTAIEGHCSDAQTGQSITNFTVESDPLGAPLLSVQPDGYFVCGTRQRFDFNKCSTATFTQFDIMEGVEQIITFSAPGYTPLVVTNEILSPGDEYGLRTYDIKMERIEDTNEGEQSGAGYPPQGVGSPDP